MIIACFPRGKPFAFRSLSILCPVVIAATTIYPRFYESPLSFPKLASDAQGTGKQTNLKVCRSCFVLTPPVTARVWVAIQVVVEFSKFCEVHFV
jgi:hypothetical protein